MDQKEFQLKWSKPEVDRIGNRVLVDYRNAIADHNTRIAMWKEYYRRWRARVDPPAAGEEDKSNLPVPYIRWNILTKLAKEMDGLFGDDAEITAVPVGPSNYKRDAKIGLFMTWLVFNYMKLTSKFCWFVLTKLIFGRAIAYSPWQQVSFEVGNTGEEVIDYDGPAFEPQWPDDIIVPAEEVQSIHDFSFVIRRYRVTPDQLLAGEDAGRYQGIRDNWDQILNIAQRGQQREFEGEEIKLEKDEAEGLFYQRPMSSGEWVTVYEWYGKWRPLKGKKKDAAENDFKAREMRTGEYVVTYLMDLNLVIGIQDLAAMYPTKRRRRPFVESSMFKDGTYWSPGMAEMLIDLEDELRVNHNQATEAGQLAVQPTLLFRPAAGMNPETIRITPGIAIPVDNPESDVKQLTVTADMKMAEWKEQTVLAYGEKMTGQSDLQMGRQIDRPNAPRTAAQTVSLLEEGNVRISLDTKMLQEDMAEVLTHFWDLEYMFAPAEQFFRVTEEDADGLFPVQDGGSIMTMEDRDGRYDFRLKFATSVHSREAKKQLTLARYQLDLQNPLIAQNPVALWEVTREAHEALGDPNFADIVPKPPEPDVSIDPKLEWVKMLHGEDVHVNPMDNDQLHLVRHMQDLQRAENDRQTDPDAVNKMIVHYHDHIAQLQQKKLQQAVVEQAMQAASKLMQAGKPLGFPHGLFGNLPSLPPGDPAAQGPFAFSGHPEDLHGAS